VGQGDQEQARTPVMAAVNSGARPELSLYPDHHWRGIGIKGGGGRNSFATGRARRLGERDRVSRGSQLWWWPTWRTLLSVAWETIESPRRRYVVAASVRSIVMQVIRRLTSRPMKAMKPRIVKLDGLPFVSGRCAADDPTRPRSPATSAIQPTHFGASAPEKNVRARARRNTTKKRPIAPKNKEFRSASMRTRLGGDSRAVGQDGERDRHQVAHHARRDPGRARDGEGARQPPSRRMSAYYVPQVGKEPQEHHGCQPTQQSESEHGPPVAGVPGERRRRRLVGRGNASRQGGGHRQEDDEDDACRRSRKSYPSRFRHGSLSGHANWTLLGGAVAPSLSDPPESGADGYEFPSDATGPSRARGSVGETGKSKGMTVLSVAFRRGVNSWEGDKQQPPCH
jgi:hypothetical protein